MTRNIKIASYNSHGSGSGRLEYINKLCNDHDIVLIQEHWLVTQQFHIYNNRLSNFNSHCISGITDSKILHGRPYGGCAVLWNKNMKASVTPVDTHSKRICAVKLLIDNFSVLICSVYMPNDSSLRNEDYKSTCSELSAVLRSVDCDSVIIGGDFNVSFSRFSRNLEVLTELLSEETLKCGLHHAKSKVIYTFESKISGHKSLIDHFVLSENLFERMTCYESLSDVDNMSDHLPVSLGLDLNVTTVKNNIPKKCFIDWNKVLEQDIKKYQHKLDTLLKDVVLGRDVLNCSDFDCKNENHRSDIQNYFVGLINACIAAGGVFPNKVNKSKRNIIPGWSEVVSESKEKALMWHSIWKSSGSPRQGIVASIRRKTRAEYHRAVKFVKANRDMFTANKMASDFSNSNTSNFWDAVKKVTKSKTLLVNNVDNCSSEETISNLFADKYKSLYNSVSYNIEECNNLKVRISENIKEKCAKNKCSGCHKFTLTEVINAISSMKRNKIDYDGECNSNHFIYGSHRLKVCLMLMFNSMLLHGFCPSEFLKSVVIPIPKNKKKSLNNSENYRGIALGSITGKIMDLMILKSSKNIFKTCDLQFGFKQDHSTMQCTFVVNEIIQYYRNRNSDVYVMLLDASKAFDKVHYLKLFNLLCKREFCPMLCRLLLYIYTSQIISVKWGSKHSCDVPVSNGVKQGGILSPVLFTIYIDVLFDMLRASGLGCYIGTKFMGAVGYADDITLLAPSVMSLKKMLQICDIFGASYDVTFNVTKYQLVHFSNNKDEKFNGIKHCSNFIQKSDFACHLGNIIGPNPNKLYDVVINKFVTCFNGLNVIFRKASLNVKYHLFKTFCMNLYGSLFWDLSSEKVNRFYMLWRKCLRMLLDLPYCTHSRFLHLIVDDIPVQVQLFKRVNNFMCKLMSSSNSTVQLCANLVTKGSCSNVCKTLNYIVFHTKMSLKILCNSKSQFMNAIRDVMISSEEDFKKVGNIKDLLTMRVQKNGFSLHEINEILKSVCTE